MRKKTLSLLFALLAVCFGVAFSAACNKSVEKADAEFTAPTAIADLIYTGEEQALVKAAVTSGGKVEYKLANGSWSEKIPTATDAGSYIVSYRLVGGEEFNDIAEETVAVTIAKAYAQITAAPAAKTLSYTGDAQELVTAGTASFGSIEYKLGEGEWGTEIPAAINAGSYTVSYRISDTANYIGVAEATVTVTIEKANVQITETPAAKTLSYTGDAQELVTAGTASFGSIEYKLDEGEWGTEIPTAINAGSYTVSWRLPASANYNGTEGTVPVAVAKGNVGQIMSMPVLTGHLLQNGAAQNFIATPGTANHGAFVEYRITSSAWGNPGAETDAYGAAAVDGAWGESASATASNRYTVWCRVAENDNVLAGAEKKVGEVVIYDLALNKSNSGTSSKISLTILGGKADKAYIENTRKYFLFTEDIVHTNPEGDDQAYGIYEFAGVLDGDGKSLENFRITLWGGAVAKDPTTGASIGNHPLWIRTLSGIVRNLRITVAGMKADHETANTNSGLFFANRGLIENCYFEFNDISEILRPKDSRAYGLVTSHNFGILSNVVVGITIDDSIVDTSITEYTKLKTTTTNVAVLATAATPGSQIINCHIYTTNHNKIMSAEEEQANHLGKLDFTLRPVLEVNSVKEYDPMKVGRYDGAAALAADLGASVTAANGWGDVWSYDQGVLNFGATPLNPAAEAV